jgi:acylphosphatase
MKTATIHIAGMVQGVGYRYFALRQANVFGITGYVRNLINGDVEVVASADEESLNCFIDQLRNGPGRSHVSSLKIVEQPARHFNSFSIVP